MGELGASSRHNGGRIRQTAMETRTSRVGTSKRISSLLATATAFTDFRLINAQQPLARQFRRLDVGRPSGTEPNRGLSHGAYCTPRVQNATAGCWSPSFSTSLTPAAGNPIGRVVYAEYELGCAGTWSMRPNGRSRKQASACGRKTERKRRPDISQPARRTTWPALQASSAAGHNP